MIDQTLAGALQQQFNQERLNCAFYQAAADALETAYWPGFARFFRAQAEDEQAHARKFAQYLTAQGITPVYGALPAPPAPAGDPQAACQQALIVEHQTTEAIDRLYFLAQEQESPATAEFLLWFVKEQVEEELAFTDQLQALTRADCSAALLILDREKLEEKE